MLAIQILGEKLHAANIPIVGVSDNGDGTFRIDFAPEATQPQRDAAAAIVAAFDPVAELAAEEVKEAAIIAAPIGARTWFVANPNAKLIWSMTTAEVVTEIASLVDNSFIGLPVATRTKWKLFLTAITLIVRILVKRERLD